MDVTRVEGQVICLQGNLVDRNVRMNGCGISDAGEAYTLNSVDRHAVCYAVYDARGNGDGFVVPTITGDHENRITDYTAILCCNGKQADTHDDQIAFAIDSHPMDSRFRISEGAVPSVTAKLAKLAADGPLVLIRRPSKIPEHTGGST